MKKLALFFVACMCLFGCEDPKVQNYGDPSIFSEKSDTSAVWRVRIYSYGRYELDGLIVVALENGKRFSIEYSEGSITKDWMLLDKGDTVICQGDEIHSIRWKKP